MNLNHLCCFCVCHLYCWALFGGLRFYRNSSFFFSRQPPAELAERNSTKIGQMLGSKRNLKMRVRNLGYPLRLKIGAPNNLVA